MDPSVKPGARDRSRLLASSPTRDHHVGRRERARRHRRPKPTTDREQPTMPEPTSDYETKASSWPVPDTVARLSAAITTHGMTIFATIDQRAAARGVGLDLR